MDYAKTKLAVAIAVLACAVATAVPAAAQQQIVLPPPILVAAQSVTISNSPVAFDDTGNANPDFDFRYDATFEGYIFNLSTKGYGTGMYSLSFTAGADPTVHTASFAVK